MSAVKPWNAKRSNAVVQAAFGVVFSEKPHPSEVRGLAEHLLSGRVRPEQARVAVPNGWVPLGEKNLPSLDGIWLEYEGRDDGVSAIGLGIVDEDLFTLTVQFSDYGGWESVWTKGALPVFAKLLPKFPESLQVSRTELLFVNRFIWPGDISNFRVDSILRREVPSAGPLPSGAAPLWHSKYVFNENAMFGQFQLNHTCSVEIKTANPRPGTFDLEVWADINVSQTLDYNRLPKDTTRTLLKPKRLDEQMNRMHEKNKAILRDLLTDAVCESINLGVAE